MGKEVSALEKRIKDNIRNYTLGMLLGEKQIRMYFDSLLELTGIEVLLTDRKGAEVAKAGQLQTSEINLDNDPGRTLIIQGRTMGHLYAKAQDDAEMTLEQEAFLDTTKGLLEKLAAQTYLQKETALYIDLKENSDTPGMKLYNVEKEDGLTGLFNKNYFENRTRIIDRAQVVPVAAILANINDWKFVNDHYGDDESDRLIQIIGEILKKEATEEYVLGRTEGDGFQVLIPMAQDGEAEDYVARVQAACEAYEDERLAPSVAIGIQYKTNVEETIAGKLSDAEYDMLENKFELKNAPGYRERLEKGLK